MFKAIAEFFKKLFGKKNSTPVELPPVVVPPVVVTLPTPPVETKPEVPSIPNKAVISGIDIYHGDNVLDWDALSKSVDFIIIKASEGDWRDDPEMKAYRELAAKHKIPCGFYHFYRSNKDPKAQADDFIRMVGKIQPGEIKHVFCDWETEDDPNDGADIDEVEKFLSIVENHFGFVPAIYGGTAFLKEQNIPARFNRYPLWVAHYTSLPAPRIPAPWDKCMIWQYTDSATVKGMGNKCDHNRFNTVDFNFADIIRRS